MRKAAHPQEKLPQRTTTASRNSPHRRLTGETPTQQVRAILRQARFSCGTCLGKLELSPRMARPQRFALEHWIGRLPPPVLRRLPRVKLVVTQPPDRDRAMNHLHAASYIPQRYIIVRLALFRRRVELGRIFYHELCHFLWTRLGNPKRRCFETALRRELEAGVRGELGHSAECRKTKLLEDGRIPWSRGRAWREYVCESFCDTGAYVLLGSERRSNHSEYTLPPRVRDRRTKVWQMLVAHPAQHPRGGLVWRQGIALAMPKRCVVGGALALEARPPAAKGAGKAGQLGMTEVVP